jgi:adenine-specific DNA methylase
MIPRKKLIEVALPLDAINKASAREKSIRHGHKFAGRPPVNPEWQGKSPEEKALRTWKGAQGLAVRELAYCLYNLCERKKRAAEALSYNGLVQSWPEISRLAAESGRPRGEQPGLFEAKT